MEDNFQQTPNINFRWAITEHTEFGYRSNDYHVKASRDPKGTKCAISKEASTYGDV